jgi:hypothetical protein
MHKFTCKYSTGRLAVSAERWSRGYEHPPSLNTLAKKAQRYLALTMVLIPLVHDRDFFGLDGQRMGITSSRPYTAFSPFHFVKDLQQLITSRWRLLDVLLQIPTNQRMYIIRLHPWEAV